MLIFEYFLTWKYFRYRKINEEDNIKISEGSSDIKIDFIKTKDNKIIEKEELPEEVNDKSENILNKKPLEEVKEE